VTPFQHAQRILIAAAIAIAIASPSNAGNGIIIERPCGSNCAAAQPTQARAVGMPFRRTGDGGVGDATYQSRSQTVIRSVYGTSVINSTFRSYSR